MAHSVRTSVHHTLKKRSEVPCVKKIHGHGRGHKVHDRSQNTDRQVTKGMDMTVSRTAIKITVQIETL